MCVNVRGIAGKIESLRSAVEEHDTHIVILSETKSSTDPPKLEGYKWIPKPAKGKSGGVALAIREDICQITTQVTRLDDNNMDII